MQKDCYQKALELLAPRPHFVEQLRQKLLDRDYEYAEIEETLERLLEGGLLNDRETAHGFVRTRLRRGPIGRRRMAMELARRGADEAVVDETLEEFFAGSELEAVRDAAGRWARRGKRDWQALARHLDRKGFAAGSIWTVVEEIKAQWAEEAE